MWESVKGRTWGFADSRNTIRESCAFLKIHKVYTKFKVEGLINQNETSFVNRKVQKCRPRKRQFMYLFYIRVSLFPTISIGVVVVIFSILFCHVKLKSNHLYQIPYIFKIVTPKIFIGLNRFTNKRRKTFYT